MYNPNKKQNNNELLHVITNLAHTNIKYEITSKMVL